MHIFLNNVAVYPTGITVELSNGKIGIVAETYEGFTTRPKVKIISDNPEERSYYLNLKDNLDVTIVNIIK
jgi:hypothetical protein